MAVSDFNVVNEASPTMVNETFLSAASRTPSRRRDLSSQATQPATLAKPPF
jgi:hypothetical protein